MAFKPTGAQVDASSALRSGRHPDNLFPLLVCPVCWEGSKTHLFVDELYPDNTFGPGPKRMCESCEALWVPKDSRAIHGWREGNDGTGYLICHLYADGAASAEVYRINRAGEVRRV